MTSTSTASETYSTVDIEIVMRRLGADFKMIAESTGAISLQKAADYQADIQLLTKDGCLNWVDVTLLDASTEVQAVRYIVSESASSFTNQRPGGVLWPRVRNPYLRVVLGPSAKWNTIVSAGRLSGTLRCSWVDSSDDTSHAALSRNGGRSYASNAFGLVREDYSR